MYPDHTTPSNPGLHNFLLYFSNNLAIFYKQYLVQQLYGVPIFSVYLLCLDNSKGENYHFKTNTPGNFKFVFYIVPAT